jgi:hypothetical protein
MGATSRPGKSRPTRLAEVLTKDAAKAAAPTPRRPAPTRPPPAGQARPRTGVPSATRRPRQSPPPWPTRPRKQNQARCPDAGRRAPNAPAKPDTKSWPSPSAKPTEEPTHRKFSPARPDADGNAAKAAAQSTPKGDPETADKPEATAVPRSTPSRPRGRAQTRGHARSGRRPGRGHAQATAKSQTGPPKAEAKPSPRPTPRPSPPPRPAARRTRRRKARPDPRPPARGLPFGPGTEALSRLAKTGRRHQPASSARPGNSPILYFQSGGYTGAGYTCSPSGSSPCPSSAASCSNGLHRLGMLSFRGPDDRAHQQGRGSGDSTGGFVSSMSSLTRGQRRHLHRIRVHPLSGPPAPAGGRLDMRKHYKDRSPRHLHPPWGRAPRRGYAQVLPVHRHHQAWTPPPASSSSKCGPTTPPSPTACPEDHQVQRRAGEQDQLSAR